MSLRILLLCLLLAITGGCARSRADTEEQLAAMRTRMLGLYEQLRPTLHELGRVEGAIGQWNGCKDRGGDLMYTFFAVLSPPPAQDVGFAERVEARIDARMREIGDAPKTRWRVSVQQLDGRVSILWVHNTCIDVDDELYRERILRHESLPTTM